MGRNLAGTSIGLWTQCDQLPHTAPLSLTAHYSCLYSSSCEPKYTLLLFRGFYQVIWSQGEGEQWLIYRKVLGGGQYAPLLPSGSPCHVLSTFILSTSTCLFCFVSLAPPSPPDSHSSVSQLGSVLLPSCVMRRGWRSLAVSSQTAESASYLYSPSGIPHTTWRRGREIFWFQVGSKAYSILHTLFLVRNHALAM